MSYPLELRDVVKRFGGLTATDNMSFRVEDGESLGLIGPNGAGKTTIFSLIMGEHRQTSGSILCNGEDISALPTYARIGRGVCRTYQVPRPFADMDVMENIRLGLMPNNLWQMLVRGPNHDPRKNLNHEASTAPAGYRTTFSDPQWLHARCTAPNPPCTIHTLINRYATIQIY